MTDKTTTQNLTRTTPTDDPKQVAGYLGTLAREVDQRVRSHFYDLGRSQRRPFALISLASPLTVDWTSYSYVQYDTVEEDTAGLVDLSVSASRIFLKETGYWMVGGYLQTTGVSAANADIWMGVSGSYNSVRDGLIGMAPVTVVRTTRVTTPNSSYITGQMLNSGSSGSNFTTIQASQLWAYKVRDL